MQEVFEKFLIGILIKMYAEKLARNRQFFCKFNVNKIMNRLSIYVKCCIMI